MKILKILSRADFSALLLRSEIFYSLHRLVDANLDIQKYVVANCLFEKSHQNLIHSNDLLYANRLH